MKIYTFEVELGDSVFCDPKDQPHRVHLNGVAVWTSSDVHYQDDADDVMRAFAIRLAEVLQ